uniref:hypothetical protein n=1 Tax=Roseivirga sp. TaxID=1964215 RepID=UPI00404714A3
MKKAILFTFMLALVGLNSIQAQDLTQPKSGNEIRLKDFTVTIAQGETLDANLWVVKSKKYKLVLGTPEASGKAGVEFNFNEKSGEELTYDMKIKVDSATPVGDYVYILKVPGTGRNAVKGSTLKVKVVQAG